jgi:hypothetical protein
MDEGVKNYGLRKMRKQESCKVIKSESSNRANTASLANLQAALVDLR